MCWIPNNIIDESFLQPCVKNVDMEQKRRYDSIHTLLRGFSDARHNY